MTKILHISANFGGGLATALHGYVENSPHYQHYLMVEKRTGYHDGMAWAKHFAGQYDLPRSIFSAPCAIRKVYQEIQPDWIHLHSSFAGAYGRMAGLPRSKVIYTPHCYAFERRDISAAARMAYLLMEQVLALGNATVAAVSPREAVCAQRMLASQKTVMLPNVPVIPVSAFARRQQHQRGARWKVAMVGRLNPQKDPDFFIATVKLAQKYDLPLDFIWLGGGEDHWAQQLKALGVPVTGWLSHEEILGQMAECDIYFHTAAWESGPLSVLEAAQLGLTLVCRSIPAIDTLPVQPSVATPAAAVDTMMQLLQGTASPQFATINATLNERYSVSAQKAALAELYG